jgi:Fic family protein
MPKQISAQELATIIEYIGTHPDGINITELDERLKANGISYKRRTLLRRLERLIAGRQLVPLGVHKGRRYRKNADYKISQQSANNCSENYIPISDIGKKILAYVRRPIPGREPVGYLRDFLLSYVPNQTAYLPQDVITHLHNIGDAKKQITSGETFARQIMGRLLIDLSWASSSLEGNTYSLVETERLISFGEEAEGKNARETQMILNHKRAIEFMMKSTEDIGFNRYTILNLHAILADNLLPSQDACGRLRSIPVGIGGSVYSPLTTPQLLDEYFQHVLQKASAITEPFEQAFFVLVHLPYLQPFEDVNKRVSRLGANIPLLKSDLCPLSYMDVPKQIYVEAILGVYELNQTDLLQDLFVFAYERSVKRYLAVRQELGNPDLFRLHYRQALQTIIRLIVGQPQSGIRSLLENWSRDNIPDDDRSQFNAVVLQELNSLHDGNIARYNLRPAEFAEWKAS